MQKMTSKLKPCPFCGGHAEFGEAIYGGYFTECSNDKCDVEPIATFTTPEGSRKAWNTRAPIEITEEMVERAAKAIHSRQDGLKGVWAPSIPGLCDKYFDFAKAALEAALGEMI